MNHQNSPDLKYPDRFIVENFGAARASVDRTVKDAAAYAKLQPEKALLWAMGAGYVLRMLPLTGILGGLIRLVLGLARPAALIYGAAKVAQKVQPLIAKASPPSRP